MSSQSLLDHNTHSIRAVHSGEDHAPTSHSPLRHYQAVRAQTLRLINGLSDADCTAQSMDDASPAKWHLAHTSWFFEEFILAPILGDSIRFHPKYQFLFNSYYDAVGDRHARPKRGLLTRPSLEEILDYRAHVDKHMEAQLCKTGQVTSALLELGLAHEQQHQELLLTDILHLFSHNALQPALRSSADLKQEKSSPPKNTLAKHRDNENKWVSFEGGLIDIGASGATFCFDCEQPQHSVYLQPYELAQQVVTNADWIEFIEAGGYQNSQLWLSDGFACAQKQQWQAPLYWYKNTENTWMTFTLHGPMKVPLTAPVCHISYYEAHAYAQWKNARLPTEAEWESAAANLPLEGHFAQVHSPLLALDWRESLSADSNASASNNPDHLFGLQGMFGNVWEWTSSAYAPYPGFKPSSGAIGEYNGKFMSGQMVLKGGSCATPAGHIRASYRNFFHPDKRWQFSGLRLARDRQ